VDSIDRTMLISEWSGYQDRPNGDILPQLIVDFLVSLCSSMFQVWLEQRRNDRLLPVLGMKISNVPVLSGHSRPIAYYL
jgi:hypothetical protein